MHRSTVALVVAGFFALAACGSTTSLSGASSSSTIGGGLGLTLDTPVSVGGNLPNPGVATAVVPGGSRTTPGSGVVPAPTVAVPVGSAVAAAPGAPITVGITYVDTQQQDAFTGQFGSSLQSGDRKAQSSLLIDKINAAGGIAGHKIVATFHKINLNGSRVSEEQAACADFTQDHHVKFVIVAELNDPNYFACLTKAGVGVIDPTYARLSEPDFALYPGLLYPAGIALDRLATVEADRFTATGFLAKTSKVGIVYYDESRFINGEKALAAALKARGITVAAEQAVHYPQTTAEVSTTVADAQSAQVRFRSRGVTHILAVDDGIPEAGFALSASSQGYHPLYGWVSTQSLTNLIGLVPEDQLKDSHFVGWYPALDVTRADQLPASTKACFSFMTSHGQPTDTGNRKLTAVSVCEAIYFLEAAMKASSGSYDRLGLMNGARLIGSTYTPTATFALKITAKQGDGVAVVRDGEYDTGCKCFLYFGSPTRL